jgi:hypothetical protein
VEAGSACDWSTDTSVVDAGGIVIGDWDTCFTGIAIWSAILRGDRMGDPVCVGVEGIDECGLPAGLARAEPRLGGNGKDKPVRTRFIGMAGINLVGLLEGVDCCWVGGGGIVFCGCCC